MKPDELEATSPTLVIGDSAKAGPPQRWEMELGFLSQLTGREAGRQHRLEQETLIGRAAHATIQLVADDISRLHARVVCSQQGDFVLEDLSSKNGTHVGGVRITSRVLESGDQICLGGGTVFLFIRRSREEEELLESQRLDSLGRLAGGIAHDFNNLLAVILGNVQLVHMHEAVQMIEDPLVEDCLTDVSSAVEQARDLVRQLLGFARRGRWEDAPVGMAELVTEVGELLTRTLDPRIVVRVSAEPGLQVMGDRQQLFQMLMNLCLNARDSMPTGGELRITATRVEEGGHAAPLGQGPQVLLQVRDTGEGMDDKTCRQVFEPFFTTRRGGRRGTGLGLAVVYGIAKGHGGRVWVESTPGEGALFHLALPALIRAEPQRAEPRGAGAPRSVEASTCSLSSRQEEEGHRARRLVLVVDDDTLVSRGVARLLRTLGFEVELASRGADALELYPRIREDVTLVLLDLVMPEMGGEEVLARLLQQDPEARVVIMSGHHDEATVESLQAAGARAFLRKPFSIEQLKAVLKLASAGA